MDAYQAILYSIAYGITEFLPISEAAHRKLIPFILNWPEPSPLLLGAAAAGALLSLLVYFRHDWASIFSTSLQVILFWKKPMTLDERIPFFILLTTLPIGAFWYYFNEQLLALQINTLWIIISLVVFSLPLWISERLNRKTKNMFDWNWVDAVAVGILQLFELLPGAGRQTGALTAAFLRNFSPEAAAKYVFYSLAPLLLIKAFQGLAGLDFDQASPSLDLSWLALGLGFTTAFLSGLLTIGAFMKNVGRNGMKSYIAYRILLAVVAGAFYYFRDGGF